MLQVNVINNMD